MDKKRLPLMGTPLFCVPGQIGSRLSPFATTIFEKGLVISVNESQLGLFYGLSFLCVALAFAFAAYLYLVGEKAED